jgi:hypothetical protein
MTTTTMVNFVIITTVMIMTIVFCHGRRRSVISSTVFLGPGFRVVSCDCRGHFADPEDYCGFCLCRCTTCGGSPVGRALSSYASRAAYGSGAGEGELARVAWMAMVVGLVVLAGGGLVTGLEAPYRCLYCLAAAGAALSLPGALGKGGMTKTKVH